MRALFFDEFYWELERVASGIQDEEALIAVEGGVQASTLTLPRCLSAWWNTSAFLDGVLRPFTPQGSSEGIIGLKGAS